MLVRAVLAGLALFTTFALAGSASAAPPAIEAAVKDPGRPAAGAWKTEPRAAAE